MDRVLDEAIPGARTEELQAHLARCPGCRRQWEALQMAEVVLRVPRPAPAPDDLLADFRRRLEAERPVAPCPTARPWVRWLWPAGSLAAAGLAAALAVTFNLPNAFEIPETSNTVLGTGTRGQATSPGSPTPESMRRKPAPEQETRTSDFALAPGNRGRSAPQPLARKPLPEVRRTQKPELAGSPALTTPAVRSKARPDETEVASGLRRHDPMAESMLSVVAPPAPPRPGGRGLERKPASQGTEKLRYFGSVAQLQKQAKEQEVPAPSAPEQPLTSFRRMPFGGVAGGTGPATSPAPGSRTELDLYAKKKSDLADRPAGNGEPLVRLKEPAANFGGGFGSAGLAGGGRPPTALSGVDKTSYFFDETDIREPRELDVSPAVLTALQRPVEVQLQGETLAGAVRQLTEAADVVLSYDPKVAGMAVNVTTPEPQVPLWVVLQEVAQQNNLQIVPRENQLELRAAKPVPGKPTAEAAGQVLSPAGPVTLGVSPTPTRGALPPSLPAPTGAPGARYRRLEPRSMLRAAKPSAGDERRVAPERKEAPELKPGKVAEKRDKAVPRYERFDYRFEREQLVDRTAPDRRVWPDLWGRLPEWGFALPTPEALPAASAPEEARAAEARIKRSPAPPRVKARRAPQK